MPTYYGLVSYQMHARMKEKEEKPPQLVVSCESRVFSTHGQKHFLNHTN